MSNGSLGAAVAKVLTSDSVFEDIPLLRADPARTPSSTGQGTILEEALQNHAEDCRRLGSDVPLVLSVAEPYIDSAREAIANSKALLDSSRIWVVSAVPAPANEIRNGDVVPLPGTGPYMSGDGFVLSRLIGEGILWTFSQSGIRWLCLGELWNLGCRLEPELLNLLYQRSDDGVAECMRRVQLRESNVLVVQLPSGRDVVQHERQLRTDEMRPLARDALWASAGTYWVRISSVHSAFDCDGLLERWTPKAGAQFLNGVLDHPKGGLLYFDEGRVVLSYRLCEVMSLLRLEPVAVPASRCRPQLGDVVPA